MYSITYDIHSIRNVHQNYIHWSWSIFIKGLGEMNMVISRDLSKPKFQIPLEFSHLILKYIEMTKILNVQTLDVKNPILQPQGDIKLSFWWTYAKSCKHKLIVSRKFSKISPYREPNLKLFMWVKTVGLQFRHIYATKIHSSLHILPTFCQ